MTDAEGLRHTARELVAVIVGGAIGTALRLAIDAAIPHDTAAFPLSTVIINTLGAFILGVLVARVWAAAPGWLRAGLGAGLLGAFTTFSAVAVSLLRLGEAGDWMTAAALMLTSVALGLAAAALGLRLGGARQSIGPVRV